MAAKPEDLETDARMHRRLVKTGVLFADRQCFPAWYFETQTQRGGRRYSVEVRLGPDDRVILDDDSLMNLETRTAHLVPATIYSRKLAARKTAA